MLGDVSNFQLNYSQTKGRVTEYDGLNIECDLHQTKEHLAKLKVLVAVVAPSDISPLLPPQPYPLPRNHVVLTTSTYLSARNPYTGMRSPSSPCPRPHHRQKKK